MLVKKTITFRKICLKHHIAELITFLFVKHLILIFITSKNIFLSSKFEKVSVTCMYVRVE